MIQFACSLIIEETETDCRLIHTADDIYHKIRKQAKNKVTRSSRKNHRNCRSVTYTFQSEAAVNQFMSAVTAAYTEKYPD